MIHSLDTEDFGDGTNVASQPKAILERKPGSQSTNDGLSPGSTSTSSSNPFITEESLASSVESHAFDGKNMEHNAISTPPGAGTPDLSLDDRASAHGPTSPLSAARPTPASFLLPITVSPFPLADLDVEDDDYEDDFDELGRLDEEFVPIPILKDDDGCVDNISKGATPAVRAEREHSQQDDKRPTTSVNHTTSTSTNASEAPITPPRPFRVESPSRIQDIPRVTLQPATPPRLPRLPVLRLSLEPSLPILPEIVVSPLAVPSRPGTPTGSSLFSVGRESPLVKRLLSAQSTEVHQPENQISNRITAASNVVPQTERGKPTYPSKLPIPCTHGPMAPARLLDSRETTPDVNKEDVEAGRPRTASQSMDSPASPDQARTAQPARMSQREARPSWLEFKAKHGTVAERRKAFEKSKPAEQSTLVQQQQSATHTSQQHSKAIEQTDTVEVPMPDATLELIKSPKLAKSSALPQRSTDSHSANHTKPSRPPKLSLDQQARAFEQERESQRRKLDVQATAVNTADDPPQTRPDEHKDLGKKTKGNKQSSLLQRRTRSPTTQVPRPNLDLDCSSKQPAPLPKPNVVDKSKLSPTLKPLKLTGRSSPTQQSRVTDPQPSKSPKQIDQQQTARVVHKDGVSEQETGPSSPSATAVKGPNVGQTTTAWKLKKKDDVEDTIVTHSESTEPPPLNPKSGESPQSPSYNLVPNLDVPTSRQSHMTLLASGTIPSMDHKTTVVESKPDQPPTFQESRPNEPKMGGEEKSTDLPHELPLLSIHPHHEQQPRRPHDTTMGRNPSREKPLQVQNERTEIPSDHPPKSDQQMELVKQPDVFAEFNLPAPVNQSQHAVQRTPDQTFLLQHPTLPHASENQTNLAQVTQAQHPDVTSASNLMSPLRTNTRSAPTATLLTRAAVAMCRWLWIEPETETETEVDSSHPKSSGLKPLLLESKATTMHKVGPQNTQSEASETPPPFSPTDPSSTEPSSTPPDEWDRERLAALIAGLVADVPAPTESDKAITLARDWALTNGMEMTECTFEEPAWWEWW